MFSAFFSGSETAFFSINYIALQKLKKSKNRQSKLVCSLLSKPNNLLITILIANMFVNILASAIASSIAINITQKAGINDFWGTTIAIVVMTLSLLFFGEITPKLIVINQPVKFARILCYPIFLFIIILKPFAVIFQSFTNLLTKKTLKDETNTLDNHDIESAIKIGHKEGIIDKDEKEMFENVFDSMTKEVQDIMLPRMKMSVLNADMPLNKLVKQIIASDYHLIPVYKNNDDNILGVVKRKDLLPYYFNLKKLSNIKSIIKPILYVPEGKNIFDLLKEFQEKHLQFALVVDEYGNTIGFITLDELIEEIVGEYKDEYDKDDIFIRQISRGKYLIKGDMKIEDFNERFKSHLKSEDSNTINGLLLEKVEKIPVKGEEVQLNKFVFTVSRRRGPIIDTLIVSSKKTAGKIKK